MNKKKVIVIIGVIVLLILGGVVFFIISFRQDKKATLKMMEEVNKEYDTFLKASNDFNIMRDTLYTDVFSDIYYDTLRENIDFYHQKLKEYETLVDSTTKAINKLDENCDGVYYPEAEANTKCMNFKEIYEQVVNCFVYDVNQINDNIEKYNEIQKEAGNNDGILKLYEHNKKFIDYNKDKEYLGKDGV